MNMYEVKLQIDCTSVGYQYPITVEASDEEEAKKVAIKTLLARLEISQFIKVSVDNGSGVEDRYLNSDKVELIWVLDVRQI